MKKNISKIYPKISVITPSYNQKDYLERTILSVINQKYQNLEFIIIDGGSTDGSIEIIEKYQEYIHYWISEKDSGQSNAINKGIMHATGDWICWQNSDDVFLDGCFEELCEVINENQDANLIFGNIILIDSDDILIRELNYVKPNFNSIFYEGMVISNQSAFWKKNVHIHIGYLSEKFTYAFDYDWFLRLSKLGKIIHVNSFWGAFRIQSMAKTSLFPEKYKSEFESIRNQYGSTINLKWLYIFRRFMLLILMGNFNYILRGIRRRFYFN